MNRSQMRGVSLTEVLVSLAILSLVIGASFWAYRSSSNKAKMELQLSQLRATLRSVADIVTSDLSNVGLGVAPTLGQPPIIRCDAFQIIFCADLEPEFGALCLRSNFPSQASEPTGNRFHILHRFLPIGLQQDWSQCSRGLVAGAETIRYSLDYTGAVHEDGLDLQNLDDNAHGLAWAEHPITEALDRPSDNPYDFYLVKELWGSVATADQPGLTNGYSGPQVIARHVRGYMLYQEFEYPNGELVYPLFTYSGHFENDLTTPDDPFEPGWPGEDIDLWGDLDNDGRLNQSELKRLYSTPAVYAVTFRPEVDANDDGRVDSYEDANGNGRLDQSLGDVIRSITLTLTLESPDATPAAPDPGRSAEGKPYPYQVLTSQRTVGFKSRR